MTEKSKDIEQGNVTAVVRAFRVLEAVAERNQIGLSDLSRMLAVHKSTLYRFLATMCDLGYLRKLPNSEEYSLTLRLFHVGSAALDRIDVVQESRAPMEWLAEQTGETVHLAMRDSSSIVYLNKIDSSHTLRMYSRIGKHAPLYCTGLGKALLAWLPEEKVQSVLQEQSFHRYTDTTITDFEALLDELKAIRERGYSTDQEEHEAGIRCAAAPIFDASGEPSAALSVSWPTMRADGEPARRWGALVREAAAQVSQAIGGSTDRRTDLEPAANARH